MLGRSSAMQRSVIACLIVPPLLNGSLENPGKTYVNSKARFEILRKDQKRFQGWGPIGERPVSGLRTVLVIQTT
jgi:hypothetical protein